MLKMHPISWITVLTLSHLSLNVQGKSLWSTQPAAYQDIIRTAYPIGNGQLAGTYFKQDFIELSY